MRGEKAEQEWQVKNHQRKVSISEMAKEQFVCGTSPKSPNWIGKGWHKNMYPF